MENINPETGQEKKDYGNHISELITDNLEHDFEVSLEDLEIKKVSLEKRLSEVREMVEVKTKKINELIETKGSHDDLMVLIAELKNKYQVIEDTQRQLASVIAVIKIKKKEY